MWTSGYSFPFWDLLLLTARVIYAGVLSSTQISPKLVQLSYGLIVLVCTCVVNIALCVPPQALLLPFTGLPSPSQQFPGLCIYSPPGSDWEDYFLSIVFVDLNRAFLAAISCFLVSQVCFIPDWVQDTIGPRVPNNTLTSSTSALA